MSGMEWTKWSAIAEIVSAVAVVVTLIFLIAGIQENTAITRVSVYGDLMETISQIENLSIADPELNRVISTLYDGTTESLTDSERMTVRQYLTVIFRNYERAYFSREYDVIGDEEWERFERLICANSRRAKLVGLDLVEQGEFLTGSFRKYIESSCGNARE